MLQGSLETRFKQSASDYADVLQTCVIEKAKAAAVETGLRQLIDDTTEGVLIVKCDNSVLCWLTGIPSERKDYMGTIIRYAIALEDEPRKMREWAGILCGLYSDQDQMKSLRTFLDGFREEDNCSVKPSLTFDKIADFLKSKIQPVQTDGIGVGCEFVLASYLAESEDSISSALSKVRMAPDKGVFWNGSGFSEVSHNVKKKRQTLAAKILSSAKPKQVSMVSNQESNQLSNQTSSKESKHSGQNSDRVLGYAKTLMIAGATTFLILILGIGVKLNNVNKDVGELSGRLDALQKDYNSLQKTVGEQKKALETLQNKVETLNKHASSAVKESQKGQAQDPNNGNQSTKKGKSDKK